MLSTPPLLRPVLLVVLLVLSASFGLRAQQPIVPVGKNLVGPLKPIGNRWYYLAAPHAQVHFYDKNKELAELTARYVEDAYVEFRRLIDLRTESRFQVYVFASPVDYLYAQMNQYNYQTADFNINRFQVYFDGSQRDFYRQVRMRTADAIVRELFYGGNLGANFASRTLLFVPDWFSNGLMRYLGEGWNAPDEAFMRGLSKEDERYFSEAISTRYHPDQSVLHKSFWYFLERTYGRRRLGEVIYMTRLTRSVESGFATVLGASSAALTIRWIEWVRTEFPTERVPVTLGARPRLPIGPNERLVAAALSPAKTQHAVLREKGGVTELLLVSYPGGAVRSTGIRFGKLTDLRDPRHVRLPLAWSPDGSRLVTAGPRQGQLDIVFYDVVNRRTERLDVGGKVQWISGVAFSPDGKRVAVSAAVDGKSDLYMLPVGGEQLTQLTATPYDELWPVWAADGKRLYYISNGGDSLGARARVDYALTRGEGDIFALNYPVAGQRPQRLTFTPFAHEWNLQLVGNRLLFITDENGLPNLAALDVGGNNAEVSYLTNFNTGVEAFTVVEGELAVVSPLDSRQRLFQFANFNLGASLEVEKTDFARQRQQRYLAELVARARELEARAARDSARADTLRADSVQAQRQQPRRRQRFYVFDERPDTTFKNRQATAASRLLQRLRTRPTAPAPFDINKVAVSKLRRPVFGLDLRSLGTEFRLDPFFRENLNVEAELTDPQLHHRFVAGLGAFFDFASTDMYLNYQFMKYRPVLEVRARKWVRYVDQFALTTSQGQSAQQITRYTALTGAIGLSYPINRFHRIGAEVEYLNINRRSVGQELADFSGVRDLVGLRLNYRFDNVYRIGRYPYRGFNVAVRAETFFSRDRGTYDYTHYGLDARHYWPVLGGVVLATRLTAGFSPGDARFRQLFMIGGVEDYVMVQFNNRIEVPVLAQTIDGQQVVSQPEAFYFTQMVAAPVRGFSVNSRNGSNYSGLSTELRVPLARLFSNTLPTRYQYQLQLVFFYDAAMAWNSGNPFSIRNPIESQVIPADPFTVTLRTFKTAYIQGFGGGLRAQLLGFLARVDVAWGIDDGAVLQPRLQVSIGKDF